MKKQFLKLAALAAIFAFASCSDKGNNNPTPTSNGADMVVYGIIYTVEDDDPQTEAFAVKDGKYVYVGNAEGAQAYVGGNTTVIDYRGKGMITPGFADCHSHYLMAEAMTTMGSLQFEEFTAPQQLIINVALEYQKAKTTGKPAIYGFGWTYQLFEMFGMPTIADLDQVCPDIPLYLSDSEGHKGLVNTLCLRKAGILNAEGKVEKQIKGGEIEVDANGFPTGLLKEQAGTYCKLRAIDFNTLLDEEKAMQTVINARDALHSKGYVSYMCGWANYYGNLRFYDAAHTLDVDRKDLNLNLGLAYEIESSNDDPMAEVDRAVETKKYRTAHINPCYVKFFIDGTVETETGYVQIPYLNPAKGHGIANWTLQEFKDITAKVNQKDYVMHVHAMGDSAVNRAVTAFVTSGRKEMRNTLVHVRNVLPMDYKVMAENNIVVTSGFLWHMCTELALEDMRKNLPEKYVNEMYPIKSYFDNGVVMSAHSDFPALSGSSEKPFDMMELACTGVLPGSGDKPYWTAELINRQQALKALTINGAYQMHSEQERGSIKVGKYADFVIVDKDVMNESCPVNQIHSANVTHTYFEGKQVYPKVNNE